MTLLAAAAKRLLQPRVGTDLVGFAVPQKTIAVNDAPHVRVLAFSAGKQTIALCSVDVCLIITPLVEAIRRAVAQQQPDIDVYCFATHTHAAPALHEPADWAEDPIASIVDAILEAREALRPAIIAAGYGHLQGLSVNRRWLDRPIDPSLALLRVDTESGDPIALLSSYANHPVVLGADNNLVSGDWPGLSSLALEAYFGDAFVALFAQGGGADLNPLTESVRQRMQSGQTIRAIGSISALYGRADNMDAWTIEDRSGGTVAEAQAIAQAYNDEALRVWRAALPIPADTIVSQSATVNGGSPDAQRPDPTSLYARVIARLTPDHDPANIPLEIMRVQIGPVLLLGQPGEVFSETAVAIRAACQRAGVRFPIMISNANGWYGYLAPESAFAEGGYEVDMARAVGLSPQTQDRVWRTIGDFLQIRLK